MIRFEATQFCHLCPCAQKGDRQWDVRVGTLGRLEACNCLQASLRLPQSSLNKIDLPEAMTRFQHIGSCPIGPYVHWRWPPLATFELSPLFLAPWDRSGDLALSGLTFLVLPVSGERDAWSLPTLTCWGTQGRPSIKGKAAGGAKMARYSDEGAEIW